MNPSPLREFDYLIAWFLFFIGATLGGAIAGFIVGAVLGGILGASGVEPRYIGIAGAVAGFLVSMPVSYAVFRLVVSQFIVRKLNAAAAQRPAS